MEDVVLSLIPILQDAHAQGGWLNVTGIVATLAVGILRRSEIQERLPERLRWDSWPRGLRLVVGFGGGFVGASCLGLASGMHMNELLLGAVEAGFLGVGVAEAVKGLSKPGEHRPAKGAFYVDPQRIKKLLEEKRQ